MQDPYGAPMHEYRRSPSPDRQYRSPPGKYYRERSRSFSPDRRHHSGHSPDRHSGSRYRNRSREDSRYSSYPPRYDSYRSQPPPPMSHTRDSASSQDRRVYVGNLSYHVRWGQLKDFMRQAGNVVFADILTLPDGRSKGCGIVEYATREEAQKAVESLSHAELDGREIYVREDREAEPKFSSRLGPPGRGNAPLPPPSSGQGDGCQIFVNNLPYSVGWQELKSLFRQAGDIIRADVQQNSQGRSKGCGTVLCATPHDADNAIAKFNGFEFGGRPLEVREDRFAKRSSFPPPFGSRSGRLPDSRGNSLAHRFSSPKPNPFTDGAAGNGEISETIFVANLPWATTDNDLVELFQTVGRVERAEIQLEPSGRSAGAGVVKFDTPASADIAIEKFSGYSYGNRPLALSFVSYRGDGLPPPMDSGL